MAKIFVFDDEISILLMVRKMLERSGHKVETALNGKEGISLFDNGKPDLLITDIIMPEKEGLETIFTLKKKYPDLKIIAISGGGRIGPDEYLPVAKILGASAVFQKPLIPKEFMQTVNDLLNGIENKNFPMQL